MTTFNRIKQNMDVSPFIFVFPQKNSKIKQENLQKSSKNNYKDHLVRNSWICKKN